MTRPGVSPVQLAAKRVAPCCGGQGPESRAADSFQPSNGEPAREPRIVGSALRGLSMVPEATLAGWAKVLRGRLAQIEAVRQRSKAMTGQGNTLSDGNGAREDIPAGGEAWSRAQELDPSVRSEGQAAGGEAERDFVLRTFRVLGDPVSYRLLERCIKKGCSSDDLAALAHLPEVAVWERVNDLIQLGLVQRALDRDEVTATAAGAALHGIVENVVALAVEQKTGIVGG